MQNIDYFGSDLARERITPQKAEKGIKYSTENYGDIIIERIIVDKYGEKRIMKPAGNYITLHFPRLDSLAEGELENAEALLASELCAICAEHYKGSGKILVCCLGNAELTPDALGPLCAKGIHATMHLLSNCEESFDTASAIAVISPGVAASSGIETLKYIEGIKHTLLPSFVIAVDSLASRSKNRLGSTVQITDTGIAPGAGIGNRQSHLTKQSLGIPVIAIGIPTVIDSRFIEYCEDEKIPPLKKRDSEPMFVSPREIDEIVRSGAKLISGAVNRAFGIY